MVFFLLMSLCATGQTRLVSFRSHSGDMRHFRNAIEHRAFDLEASNLGETPKMELEMARLDSVIRLPDGKIVLVTSKDYSAVRLSTDGTTLPAERLPRRDTVMHQLTFPKYNDVDSIKKFLRSEYRFRNNIDSVAFVGYGKKEKAKKSRKKGVVPAIWVQWPKMGLFLLLAIGSGLVAFSFWRLKALETSLATSYK